MFSTISRTKKSYGKHRERGVKGKREEGGGEVRAWVRVVRSETLEAPAAVRSSTPRGRETQKTPCGGAHDAQTRGADVPSHALMSGLEEADARRAASYLRSVSSGAAAAIHHARG